MYFLDRAKNFIRKKKRPNLRFLENWFQMTTFQAVKVQASRRMWLSDRPFVCLINNLNLIPASCRPKYRMKKKEWIACIVRNAETKCRRAINSARSAEQSWWCQWRRTRRSQTRKSPSRRYARNQHRLSLNRAKSPVGINKQPGLALSLL